jgi:hypothetical protein
MGSFGRGSRFDLTADKEGVHIQRERSRVGLRIHYYVLADMLQAAAPTVAAVKDVEPPRHAQPREAAVVCRRLA